MLFRSGCRQSDCHLVPSKERQRDGWIETRGHGCLRRLPSGVVRYPLQDPGLLRPGRLCPLRGKSRTASCFRNPSSDGPRPAGVRRSLAAPGGRGKRTAPRASWSTGSMLATGGGAPLISTGVVFASRGPPRFAPSMYRNSRPNHSPAPCPRESIPAVPRQSEARYPHPRGRQRRRRGPRRTVGVVERPDRPDRRGARYHRPSRPARRNREGGHADRLSRAVHAWVGWDGSVSRQSMVSMTIIRQTSTPMEPTAIPDPGADARPQVASVTPRRRRSSRAAPLRDAHRPMPDRQIQARRALRRRRGTSCEGAARLPLTLPHETVCRTENSRP
ncbi:hypothetical protein MBRA_05657 [Methylobacterium brachiatum]|nr:hypothetical protein MBRA_05657 [Methylobacterium brachiatum]